MGQQDINLGNAANDGTGDPARTAFDKIQDNFDELYALSSRTVNAGDVQWASLATVELRIQAAIDFAVANNADRVFVPANMLPYTASSVTFNSAIQMVREGGDSSVYDVRAYGAAGDGVTNDLPSIHAAIASAPAGSTVFFPLPTDTFAINGPILATKAMTFTGYGFGSIIEQIATTSQNVMTVSASDVEIFNLKLVGNGVSTGTTFNLNGVLITGCDGCTVRNCWIDNASLSGVQISVGTNRRHRILHNLITNTNTNGAQSNASDIFLNTGTIEDCEVSANHCRSTKKSGGIILQPGSGGASDVQRRNRVTDNFVDTSTQQGQPTGHGILVYIVIAGATNQDCIIARNMIRQCDGMGIYVKGLSGTPVVGCIVSENVLLNTMLVGTAGTLADAAIGLAYTTHTIVSGNSIRLGGSATTDSAIRLFDEANDCIVVGNAIRDWTQRGIYLSGTVDPVRAIVVGNSVAGSFVGIQLHGSDHRIANNVIRATSNSGILVANTASDALVQGNRVSGVGGGGYGLEVQAGAVRCHLLDNQLTGNTFAFNDGGTGTVAIGNRQTTAARFGRAVLVNGTVTVSTAEVVASENIRLTRVVGTGTTRGVLSVGTITAGTSFVINSTDLAGTLSADDDSTVFWEIVH